jgi:hypothetical protein
VIHRNFSGQLGLGGNARRCGLDSQFVRFVPNRSLGNGNVWMCEIAGSLTPSDIFDTRPFPWVGRPLQTESAMVGQNMRE